MSRLTRILLLILSLAARLDAGPAATGKARPPVNVVLFFVDMLRADHVGIYGYSRRPITPCLDALAGEGTRFAKAHAQSSWSLPSYTTIFTSLYPPSHGTSVHNQKVDPSLTTLASVFAAHGYRTGAFVGGGHLSHIFGLTRGFQVYRDEPPFGSFQHTVPPALDWMMKPSQQPFFAVVHSYDVHAPYKLPLGFDEMYDPDYRGPVHTLQLLEMHNLAKVTYNTYVNVDDAENNPPGLLPGGIAAPRPPDFMSKASPPQTTPGAPGFVLPLGPRDLEHIIAHYDGSVTYADTWLGTMLESLERGGILQNTLVVVTSDHGDDLGTHGYFRHGVGLYSTQTHVPLVFAGPGVARGRQVTDVVELVDLAPTLLELTGIEPCRTFQGRSLGPWLRHGVPPPPPNPDHPAFCSLDSIRVGNSIRTGRWCLMDIPKVETLLFDLASDPTETLNVTRRHPDVAVQLRGQLQDWLDRTCRPWAQQPGKPAVGPDLQEVFRQRGYW